jgi:hypothetical protein
MSTHIQVPDGYKLVTKTSSKFPEEHWHSIEMIEKITTQKPWWKFWLPDFLYSYTVIEKIKK